MLSSSTSDSPMVFNQFFARGQKKKSMEDQEKTFKDLNLDTRLLKALNKIGVTKPTLIQENVIPFGTSGKDILAKAKTGSGKTLAYVLPLLHRLLTEEVCGLMIFLCS